MRRFDLSGARIIFLLLCFSGGSSCLSLRSFFLIFHDKNQGFFFVDFFCLMNLSFGREGRLTPKVRLGWGKNSGWCPIPFFDWVVGAWVTGPSLSLRFERLPEAYRPTEARRLHK